MLLRHLIFRCHTSLSAFNMEGTVKYLNRLHISLTRQSITSAKLHGCKNQIKALNYFFPVCRENNNIPGLLNKLRSFLANIMCALLCTYGLFASPSRF